MSSKPSSSLLSSSCCTSWMGGNSDLDLLAAVELAPVAKASSNPRLPVAAPGDDTSVPAKAESKSSWDLFADGPPDAPANGFDLFVRSSPSEVSFATSEVTLESVGGALEEASSSPGKAPGIALASASGAMVSCMCSVVSLVWASSLKPAALIGVEISDARSLSGASDLTEDANEGSWSACGRKGNAADVS